MKGFCGMRKARYVVTLLVAVSVLLAFGSVWASSEGEHEGGIDKGKDLIYRTLNFGVLAVALFFLLKKPLSQALGARTQGIKDKLNELELQKQQAEGQLAEHKSKLTRLDEEMEKIVAEYVKDGEAIKAKIIEEAKASAEKLQEQAKKNIENEFKKAREELKAEMAEQAVAMAEGLIKKHIKDEDQQRIIDEYLTKVVVA